MTSIQSQLIRTVDDDIHSETLKLPYFYVNCLCGVTHNQFSIFARLYRWNFGGVKRSITFNDRRYYSTIGVASERKVLEIKTFSCKINQKVLQVTHISLIYKYFYALCNCWCNCIAKIMSAQSFMQIHHVNRNVTFNTTLSAISIDYEPADDISKCAFQRNQS